MNEPAEKQFVILLHGLCRTRFSMRRLERALSAQGFITLNIGYPSTRHDIRRLAELHVAPAVRRCLQLDAASIHFVTHSLGGILLRQYLQAHSLPKSSRIVMIAPPNRGSEIAEFFRRFRIYRWILGPSAMQLGIAANSVPNQLAPIAYEVGVIAGKRSSDPWFAPLMNGMNDGKVSVLSTRLPEMSDFVIVNSGHTLIIRSSATVRQVLAFLNTGHFLGLHRN